MSKLIRKIKRWIQRFGRPLMITIMVLAVLWFGVWFGLKSDKSGGPSDFGDSLISDVSKGIAQDDYHEALAFIASGNEEKGREMMRRLAPLRPGSQEIRGNADAHFWMANDLMGGGVKKVLRSFPMAAAGGKALPVVKSSLSDDVLAKVKLHLESAVWLDPSRNDAWETLAELMLAEGKRNEAITMLIERASAVDGGNPNMGVLVANALAYEGDDLALNENAWRMVTSLGREVSGRGRAELRLRMEYLFYVLVVGKEELVDLGVKSFTRDFESAGEGKNVVTAMQANAAYFSALKAWRAKEPKVDFVLDELLAAHAAQPGREDFINALQTMLVSHPDQKERVLGAMKKVDISGANPEDTARWRLMMAGLDPDHAAEHLKAANTAHSQDAAIVIAYLQSQIDAPEADFKKLAKEAAQHLERPKLGEKERFILNFIQGRALLADGNAKGALLALEKALALKNMGSEDEQVVLHKSLAEAYRACGLEEMAAKHVRLAGKE